MNPAIEDVILLAYKLLIPTVSILQAFIGLRLLIGILSINNGVAKRLLVIWGVLLVIGATSNIVVIIIRNITPFDESLSKLPADILMFTQLILLILAYRCIRVVGRITEIKEKKE